MKKHLKLGLIALAVVTVMIIVTVFTVVVFVKQKGILETKTVYMDFTVDHFGGMTTATDALHFGTITPGGGGMRPINFTNDYSFPVHVVSRFSGEAGEYVWMVPEEVILEPGTHYTVEMKLQVPNYLSYGNYSGEAHFTFKRVK